MIKIIIILAVGAIVGYLLGRNRIFRSAQNDADRPLNQEQLEKRRENLEKILASFSTDEEITNDKVQELLGVANATAERYLDELEKRGKLTQIGTRGKYVIYKRIQ